MIKLMPNKNTSKIALYFLTITTLIFALLYGIEAGGIDYTYSAEINATGEPRANDSTLDEQVCGLNNVECEGGLITVKSTAFSSVECHTVWCRNNPERVGHQVALNAKYGKAKQVYIPQYGKAYEVIGTTDYKTDMDIYYGTNGQGALEYGVRYVDIKVIK